MRNLLAVVLVLSSGCGFYFGADDDPPECRVNYDEPAMPDVDLEFSTIRFSRIPVVVLNLRAPSALLGFQLGGIVGHRFLSKYLVTIDMDRSVVGLDTQ